MIFAEEAFSRTHFEQGVWQEVSGAILPQSFARNRVVASEKRRIRDGRRIVVEVRIAGQ
jgi:hypothetical protein